MKIRKLKLKDAPLMLEWMHDEGLVEYFHTNFMDKSLRDCEAFIQASAEETLSRNWAICNDADEYLGTVSLKHIDGQNAGAEYAIAVRRCALGTGAARFGSEEILKIAFEELVLDRVYLTVLEDNVRAKRFYEKLGFTQETSVREQLFVKGKYRELKRFALTRTDYLARKATQETAGIHRCRQ